VLRRAAHPGTGPGNAVAPQMTGASGEFDQVIVASGPRPVNALAEPLAALGIPFTAVGDCTGPRKIQDAVHGGFLAALNCDQHQHGDAA